MAIKRGVSFYSYQQAQFFGEMDWKDMCKELHDNLHCDGVEIMKLPFPAIRFLRKNLSATGTIQWQDIICSRLHLMDSWIPCVSEIMF